MGKRIQSLILIILIVVLAGTIFTSRSTLKDIAVPTEFNQDSNADVKRNLSNNEPLFLAGIPSNKFDTLTLDDIPLATEHKNFPEIIVHNNTFLFLSTPYILEYSFTGKLLRYTNRTVLGCADSIAMANNYLYVACNDLGVYRINLFTEKIIDFYGQRDGLQNVQNLQLVADGDTLWAGTFGGIAKLDINTRNINFYKGIPNKHLIEFVGHIYAKNGRVWADISKKMNEQRNFHGLARYEKSTDQWIAYTEEIFTKSSDPTRISLNFFLLSDDGLYAVFNDNNLDKWVLAKFKNNEKPAITYYDDKIGMTNALPPLESYESFRISESSNYNDIRAKMKLYVDEKWITVPITYKEYQDIKKVGPNKYYLLHWGGIEVLNRGDLFPVHLVDSDKTKKYASAKLFVTDDNYYVAFISQIRGEYEMEPHFGIGVYDRKKKEFFEQSLSAQDTDTVMESDFNLPQERGTMNFHENLITLDFGEHGSFFIDLEKKKAWYKAGESK